jgi:lysophospholipase
MHNSLRGELTERGRTHFQHPTSGTLTPEISSLTALGYAIQDGDALNVRDVVRGENRWLLNDVDYSGNTPVVSYDQSHTLCEKSLTIITAPCGDRAQR